MTLAGLLAVVILVGIPLWLALDLWNWFFRDR